MKKGKFLASQVSAIFYNELPHTFKDLGTPMVSYIIGDKKINIALLDLGLVSTYSRILFINS